MSKDGTTTFFFTQGENKCIPPPGFEDYFGPAPHYRFIEYDGIEQNDVLERVRDFPEGENPEDVLRELLPGGSERIQQSVQNALDALYSTMEKHGPFDAICAYSEGTVIGGSLILDEQRRFEAEGRPRQIKKAVFFAGWPPLKPNSNEMLLSDISEMSQHFIVLVRMTRTCMGLWRFSMSAIKMRLSCSIMGKGILFRGMLRRLWSWGML
jgi:hypothetical protein